MSELCAVYIPSLLEVMKQAQQQKGHALTEDDVAIHVTAAKHIVVPLLAAQMIAQSRGFEDLDASDCWNGWIAHNSKTV